MDMPATADDVRIDRAALSPCVAYECTSDLLVTKISPNVFDLVGIHPETVVGTRVLWEDKILSEDRIRLLERLNRLTSRETGSAVHKITDDAGLRVWVTHSFRKIKTGCDATIHGCMVPLGNAFCATALDISIVSQFIHKIGNHFQLINLLLGSSKRRGMNIDELEVLLDQAVELTRSFSDYSQAPVGAAIDLAGILHSEIELMTASCIEKNVTFQHVVEEAINDSQIIADAYLLELAFGSVLKNALEATKSGNQIILKASREIEHRTGRAIARILIADTGSGMEPDMLAKAADPFFTSKRDRNGLGLSTALRVIESHGGTLNVTSAPGRGTQVVIVLPLTMDLGEGRRQPQL
jgi:signal transduction histidine kinase